MFSRNAGARFRNDKSIQPGGYLVVAADVGVFKAKYPEVTTVVGGWKGILSNSGNELVLEDAVGNRVETVHYADEGNWGYRERGPNDLNHRGWLWTSEADGRGKSLELMNPILPGNHGRNWSSNTVTNGTPGRPNSVSTTNIPPMVLEVIDFPVVPTSIDPVTVTARILDESRTGQVIRLHHRIDGPSAFLSEEMFDDGLHGDGRAADGVYGATIPPEPNNTVVEFYIEAADSSGFTRFWPAAANVDGVLVQAATLSNCRARSGSRRTRAERTQFSGQGQRCADECHVHQHRWNWNGAAVHRWSAQPGAWQPQPATE